MQFEELSFRLQQLKDEIADIQKRNDRYSTAVKHTNADQIALQNRRVRLQEIKDEIAAIIAKLK